MQQVTPLPPLALSRTVLPHATHSPPYSPTLINLNHKYNMSANSLTEALLLLSGMYITLVQPDPGPIRVGLHTVFPTTADEVIDSVNVQNKYYQFLREGFNISSGSTRSNYAPKDVLNMLCNEVFPNNTITMLYVNNPNSLAKYYPETANYLPRVIESLGLPIISYDTQFSPNSRPNLSVQLAPTIGQMIDVMFAFLKRFGWTDFSFLCTLSSKCQDEISFIRLKIEEYKSKTKLSVYGVDTFTYQLLSYVNFTDGTNVTEVREKLMYDLHKDSRINLFHGSGSEVKEIMTIAGELGLTGKEYVWIFTGASITLNAPKVAKSYPLGSFVIGFDDSRGMTKDTVRAGVNLWLDALKSLAKSPDIDSIDFNTGFSCDKLKEDMARNANSTSKSPLFWKYGKILYSHIIKSKMPGDLEFDEYGVLKANKFFIYNIQLRTTDRDDTPTRRPPGKGLYSGVGGSSSARVPVGSFRLPSSRETEQPSNIHTGRNDRDSDSTGRESIFPVPRDRDRDTRFSSRMDKDSDSASVSDNDLDSSPSRHRVPSSSESRELGYKLSNDKDLARDTSSPSPRARFVGSRFSRERHQMSLRDALSESDFSESRESGAAPAKDRRSSLASDIPDSGRSHSQPSSSDTSFNYHPSDNTFRNSWASFLDPSQTPVLSRGDNSWNASKSSFPDSKAAHDNSNDRHGFGLEDENSNKRSSGPFNRDRIRRREREGNRGNHKVPVHLNGHNNNGNRSQTIRNKQFRRRSSREVKDVYQVAKKVADWDGHTLSMYDITWPGGATKPPKGKPEKYILKVVTWQEDPHVIYREMQTGLTEEDTICEVNSVPCTVYNRDKKLQRTNGTKDMCCTGLCIDLLKRLGERLNFDVQLTEVADGSYGSPIHTNLSDWTGMLGMLIHKEADLAIGALSITPERSATVEFSVPFLQTGITIIVALRHGVISPTAFLEPYDYPSWSLILLFSVHATGASIFIFEWLSPYGLDQGKTSYSVHKFSLFRSFWLIWAMLFGASVSTDQPRGIASRFLANIWALFAVVFCASYTANLAAFMITKDTFYDLSGIQDWRLKNPHHVKPPFKFATIANSSTDLNIYKNYKDIHQYMKNDMQTDVKNAIINLKAGSIQAFIYDSTTLEYEVGKDDGCKLKTVGKRIAETGYGVAFPKKSPWVKEVDRALLEFQENGEIERLQKHWLARACHNKKETSVSSHTLGILNFTSAFVLLGSGVVLGVLILLFEHMYFRFGRKSLKKLDKCGCCSLVSLSMGQSLTFEQSVMEAMDYHKQHRCQDPLCETQLWKAKHDLDIALLKISQLRRLIASSASLDVAKGGGYGASSKNDSETSPHQNGAARRRRQNTSDAGSGKVDRSVNQPLLAVEGKPETEDDDTPVQSPKRLVSPYSQRSSFPAAKDKAAVKDSSRYSYPEQGGPREDTRRAKDERPPSRITTAPRNSKGPSDGRQKVTDLDFHPPPPSFDEAMSRYTSSPADEVMTPSPPLPSPPSSPPPPAKPTPLYHSPHGGVSALSDSNPSISSPSSEGKRYEPFILDSPESPCLSFSETSDNRLSCPGTLSKLSDEIPSTAVSQDMDSNFTSSPEMSKSLDDSNISPHLGISGPHFSNVQTKHPSSSIDIVRPSSLHEDTKSDSQRLLLNSSKEADNDVSTRRIKDNDGNIYVNIDDIAGTETSF